jgi:glucose-1-phosphate adenylyltransferase
LHSYAQVDSSVLMSDVRVGRSARVQNAIIDKNVVVPPHAEIGVDPAHDRQRGFTVSDGGVVVVGKNETVEL